MHQTIRIHAAAPLKPALGQACNGCGVCCAAEPCPLGVLVSRRRTGSCKALLWNPAGQRYVCGLLSEPSRFVGVGWGWATRLTSALARRFVSAGTGCDSDAELLR